MFPCIMFAYFIFPYVAQLVSNNKKKLIISLIGVAFLTITMPIIVVIFKTSTVYSNPFFRLSEFVSGMLLAKLFIILKPKVKCGGIKITVASIILVVGVTVLSKIAFRNHYTMYNILNTPVFMYIIYILASCDSKIIEKIVNNKMFRYLNTITYEIFLAQLFTFKIVNELIYMDITIISELSNIQKLIFSIVLNIIISIILHEGIQKPIKKYLTQNKFDFKKVNIS